MLPINYLSGNLWCWFAAHWQQATPPLFPAGDDREALSDGTTPFPFLSFLLGERETFVSSWCKAGSQAGPPPPPAWRGWQSGSKWRNSHHCISLSQSEQGVFPCILPLLGHKAPQKWDALFLNMEIWVKEGRRMGFCFLSSGLENKVCLQFPHAQR